MDEMVGDAMDSSLDDVEEETEEEVDKILNELAVDSVAAMPAAGRQRAAAQPTQLQAAQAAEEEEDLSGLQARLDAIRAG
jgi:charged multivesicular body protein 3